MIATQHSLVARMRDGGSDSDWQKFYHLYEAPILAFAASRSLSEAECADVLQETMVKMLRTGFSRFEPGKGGFTASLFHIAKCCAIDALRRRTRRESRHVPLDTPPPDGSSPLEERMPDRSASPADAAERHGQMALVSTALRSPKLSGHRSATSMRRSAPSSPGSAPCSRRSIKDSTSSKRSRSDRPTNRPSRI